MLNGNASPPAFVAGEEWWQQLVSYGLSRRIDAQYLEPYQNNNTDQTALDNQGNAYTKGQPAMLAANAGTLKPWLLAGGALAAVALVIFLVRK
jgi:hypothetical protein